MVVKHYYYADTDPAARVAAQHRIVDLAAQYPNQLSPELVHAAFQLPQDVKEITAEHLQALRVGEEEPWLVVAGWPCQDLSPAGTGLGLQGPRSNLFYDVHRLLLALQSFSTAPVAYLLENAAMRHNFNHAREGELAYAELTNHLGQPVCLDAAQFNSRAHRLRNYWTNLASPGALLQATACWHRAPGLLVNDVLDPNCTAQVARRDDTAPFYPANRKGKPLSALPTIVAYPASHAYREGRVGMVWDAALTCFAEPNADERERALGYLTGSTAAPGLTPRQRHVLLGNCIDQNLLQALFALSRAVCQLAPIPSPPALMVVAPCCPLGGEAQREQRATLLPAMQPAAQQPTQQSSGQQQGPDIWEDSNTMHFLRHGTHHDDTPLPERKRAQRRATSYILMGANLFRVFRDGSRKEVPAPSRRSELITTTHNDTGHFGIARTTSLLKAAYWWHGMGEDVAKYVNQCELCARVQASFNACRARSCNTVAAWGTGSAWASR
jgi:hypothetical protein